MADTPYKQIKKHVIVDMEEVCSVTALSESEVKLKVKLLIWDGEWRALLIPSNVTSCISVLLSEGITVYSCYSVSDKGHTWDIHN